MSETKGSSGNGKRFVIPVKGGELHQYVKRACEEHPHYEPTHFFSPTFYRSSPARHDRDWAVATFQRFCVSLAKKINSHIIPVACVGKTDAGAWHIHAVLLSEKGRRRATYREIKKLWVDGYKSGKPEQSARGRQQNVLYDPNQGGVIYTLKHAYYIPVPKPFCPGKKKCKPLCVKLHSHKDIVRVALTLKQDESHLSAFAKVQPAQGSRAPL